MRSCGALGSGLTVSTHLIFSRSTDPLKPFRFGLKDGGKSQMTSDKCSCTVLFRLEISINLTQWRISAVPSTYPFVRIKIVVGYFFLGENKPSLLVVQRGCLLLLLRAFNEDFFQYVIWHGSVRINLQETREQEVMITFVKCNNSIIPGCLICGRATPNSTFAPRLGQFASLRSVTDRSLCLA